MAEEEMTVTVTVNPWAPPASWAYRHEELNEAMMVAMRVDEVAWSLPWVPPRVWETRRPMLYRTCLEGIRHHCRREGIPAYCDGSGSDEEASEGGQEKEGEVVEGVKEPAQEDA